MIDTIAARVVDVALSAVGGTAEDVLFLAGSTVDGIANDGSDIDVYFIGDLGVVGNATTVRRDEKTGSIGHLDGRDVSLSILAPGTLAELRDAFMSCVESLSQTDGFAQLVVENDLKILHRVRTGIPLVGAGGLDVLRDELRTEELPRYLANLHGVTAFNRLADVAGELTAGNQLSARWMFREALARIGHFTLATNGVTNSSNKWLVRLLLLDGPDADYRMHLVEQLTTPALDVTAALPAACDNFRRAVLDRSSLAAPYLRRLANSYRP